MAKKEVKITEDTNVEEVIEPEVAEEKNFNKWPNPFIKKEYSYEELVKLPHDEFKKIEAEIVAWRAKLKE